MKFLRLNASEADPNPHINFITPLKTDDEGSKAALDILTALAAQVRPVMKKHGLEITSFEEYEHNTVFLGRNWNNGETVELVLRRGDGSFYSTPHLINVLCHEMSHILHMHHGPSFWAYYHELKREVQALQKANYFGDGFWSSGRVLKDGTQDNRLREVEDLPEYLCGGAHAKPPPRRGGARKRKANRQAGPSSSGGKSKRKAGTRVRSQNVFKGDGKALNADIDEETRGKLGTGFRKQAGSKRARELRAAAIEARLTQAKGVVIPGLNHTHKVTLPTGQKDDAQKGNQSESDGSTTETEDDLGEIVKPETDAERLQLIEAAADQGNTLLRTQSHLADFWTSPTRKGKAKPTLIVLSDDEKTESEEEEAGETLKKFGLSIEEEVDSAVSGGGIPGPSKGEPAGHIQEKSAREHTEGQWACTACTFVNYKPLGLQCEVCGSLRRDIDRPSF